MPAFSRVAYGRKSLHSKVRAAASAGPSESLPEWICTLTTQRHPQAIRSPPAAPLPPVDPDTVDAPKEEASLPAPVEQTPAPVRGPIMRLFNGALGACYEVEVLRSSPAAEGQSVVVAATRTVLGTADLNALVCATAQERVALAPPSACVTWENLIDLLETSGVADAAHAVGARGWNVRVFQCHPAATDSTRWTFATPSLTTAHERRHFLSTNVELLYQYYKTPLLFALLEQTAALTEEVTPPSRATDRSSESIAAAPEKMPPEVCPQAEQEGCGDGSPLPMEPEARSLHESFEQEEDAACSGGCGVVPPSSGTGEWLPAAMSSQLRQWQQRQQSLCTALRNTTVAEALRNVRQELQCCASRPRECWSGLWMISLREYESDLLIMQAGHLLAKRPRRDAAGTAPPESTGSASSSVSAEVRKVLGQCSHAASQVVRVSQRLLAAAEEREILQPQGTFPFSTQRVLLLVSTLRGLRHLAIVEAVGYAPAARQHIVVLAAGVAQRLVDAVRRVGPLSDALSALASTLLLGGLSMLEVALALEEHEAARCRLAESAMDVFAAWQRVTQDPQWAPRCVQRLLEQIASQSAPVASASQDGGDATGHVARLMERCISATPPSPFFFFPRSGLSAAEPDANTERLPCMSHCLRNVWSPAALDQLFHRTEKTLVRLHAMDAAV